MLMNWKNKKNSFGHAVAQEIFETISGEEGFAKLRQKRIALTFSLGGGRTDKLFKQVWNRQFETNTPRLFQIFENSSAPVLEEREIKTVIKNILDETGKHFLFLFLLSHLSFQFSCSTEVDFSKNESKILFGTLRMVFDAHVFKNPPQGDF